MYYAQLLPVLILKDEEMDGLPVKGDDVVLPDHVVDGVDALVDVTTTSRLAVVVVTIVGQNAYHQKLVPQKPVRGIRNKIRIHIILPEPDPSHSGGLTFKIRSSQQNFCHLGIVTLNHSTANVKYQHMFDFEP